MRRIALLTTAAALLLPDATVAATVAPGQDALEAGEDLPRFGEEGPLRNDTFAATSRDARADLARGDRSWRRLRDGEGEAARVRAEAFDAWQSALESSVCGDAVPLVDETQGSLETADLWPDPDRSARRRLESVAGAVLRRLSLIGSEERTAWRARFEPLAAGALEAAGTARAPLERVERNFPCTDAALRAALRLADLALERGSLGAAASYLERAERHAAVELGRAGARVEDARILAALAARRAALAGLAPRPPADETWRVAGRLVHERTERLEGRPVRARHDLPFGMGVTPGLAFLDDGAFVVQSPIALILMRARPELPSGGSAPPIGRFPLRDLVGEHWSPPFASPVSGGWPLLPATDGRRLVLVVGRAAPSRQGRRGIPASPGFGGQAGTAAANLVACFDFDPSGFPRRVWSLGQDGLLRGDARVPLEDVLGPGSWAFQPGPLVHDGRVFVQARRRPERGQDTDTTEGLFLLALDLLDGALVWKRFLTEPADLRPDLGGRSSAPDIGSPAQPLARAGERIFAGTNVGLAFLFDAADGRLAWAFRGRRRPPGEPGWSGSQRPPVIEPMDAGAPASIVWAPFDSDVVYTLAAAPDLDGTPVLSPPGAFPTPLHIDNAHALIGASREELLVLTRAGARAALSTWSASGTRRSSLYLGLAEHFAGEAAVSRARVIAATSESLLLFDRQRELYLTGAQPIPDAGAGRGGSVYAQGSRVVVVGTDTFWIWRAER